MKGSGQLYAPVALPPGEMPAVPFAYQAGLASEQVWVLCRETTISYLCE